MPDRFTDQLEWRFATKRFNPHKKVPAADFRRILKAIRFTPSSMGLQPYHVVVVGQPKLKRELRKHSFDQAQITDCHRLLVFCARNDIRDRIKGYVKVARKQGSTKLEMKGFELMANNFLRGTSATDLMIWAKRQAYIALGFGLAACAELGVDSCPMEGFNPAKYKKVLGLPKEMEAVALLAVGYRGKGPAWKKVRFPETDLFSRNKSA
jgi:nitroreductase/dihydropteridine reductase